MTRDGLTVLRVLAALPLVAIVAVLAGWQPPGLYLNILRWGTTGSSAAFGVLALHAAPMMLVLLLALLRRSRTTTPPSQHPESIRPAVDSGPFGRLIE